MVRLRLDHPALAQRMGRGVRVAVVDSGIAAGHPHVGDVTTGVHVTRDGADQQWRDRIGHGTAVAAAIREKAPAAELVAVRVFDQELVTTADILARGIRHAADLGVRLINLSLGTENPAHAAELRRAVQQARSRNALVVTVLEVDGRPQWPGVLPEVIAVRLDWTCPREEIRTVHEGGRTICLASGYPRPVPGVPPERNLKGASFAVANVTGLLARLLEP